MERTGALQALARSCSLSLFSLFSSLSLFLSRSCSRSRSRSISLSLALVCPPSLAHSLNTISSHTPLCRFAENGGHCLTCPTQGDSVKTITIIAGVFVAIASVAFALVAVVQLSFGRGIFMGAVRSLRFAGWIVAALATQAQIGRTVNQGQPPALKEWYRYVSRI